MAGRPNTLRFNKAEFAWISHQVSRLEKLLDPADNRKPRNKIIKRIASKFHIDIVETGFRSKGELFPVKLDRQETRGLEEILIKGIKVLDERIIPEYSKRIEQGLGGNLGPYLDKVNALKGTLGTALETVQKVL